MAKANGYVVIDIERCKGCELCIPFCPPQVLAMSKNLNIKGYHFLEVTNENCTACTNCSTMCPDGAITVYRDKK